MCVDSQEGATALLHDSAAALAEVWALWARLAYYVTSPSRLHYALPPVPLSVRLSRTNR